ncbi:MAG: polysaccharide biosynthesis/export family protein, partial [Planctomycetes bacterium]|nr:polysaccharide biosynthesis/export family protein [Planctomycetota bacterium]
ADKAEKMAQLELQQLETSLLQRELEHSHSTMLQLKSLQETDSEEAQQERERLFARIRDESEVTKEKLAEELLKTAKLAAELEVLELDRTGLQRRLETLQAVRTQFELPQLISRPIEGAAASETPPMATGIGFAPMPSYGGPSSGAASAGENATINPGDIIQIEVRIPSSDQATALNYTVESMGTVAMGATYGRVKVAGLTILQAEEAIKKQVSKHEKDPHVQVTFVGSASPMMIRSYPGSSNDARIQQAAVRQFEELQRTLNSLKVENARLKKQLEQLAPRSPR